MFYNLHTTWQMILLVLALAILALISWHRPKWGAWSIVFLAPLYLIKISFWPLTALEALTWVFVLIWLVKRGLKKEKIKAMAGSKLFLPIALILTGVSLSIFFSTDWRVGLGVLKAWFVAPLVFSYIFAQIFEAEEGRKVFFTALAISAGGTALIAALYFIFSRLTFDGRLAAFYLSPNHLAMWLAPGLIAGLSSWFEAKKAWQRSGFLVINILLLISLYFTFSYGAWLGLGVALIFAVICLRYFEIISTKKLAMIIGLLLFFLVLVGATGQFNGDGGAKLEGLLSSPRSSWQSRLMIWQSALLIVKDYWLIGVGPGLFQPQYLAYQKYFSEPYLEWAVPQPHNLFLAWWLQAGLLGLVGWLWLTVIFFRQTRRTLLTKKSLPTIFLLAVMVYFLVHGLVDTPFWKNDLALIFWLTIFLGCKADRRAC